MQRVRVSRARERAALTLALALHGAGLLGVWRWARTRRVSPPVPNVARPAVDRVFEVELEDTVPSTATTARPAASAVISIPHLPPFRARTAEHLTSPGPAEPTAAEANAEASNAVSSASNAAPRVVDLGLGANAWQAWLEPRGAPAPRAAALGPRAQSRARPASSTGGLQEGLEAHDRALGLGTSGPVVSAIFRASHDPIAPETGVAHFRVTVLKSGEVQVTLNDATDQLPGWRAVAGKAEAALRRSPPNIPPPRAGVHLVIEVIAEEAFPNGVKQKDTHGPRLEAEGPRFRTSSQQQASLQDLNPLAGQTGEPLATVKANVDLPGVFVAGKGKVCSYRVGITPLGPLLQGGCDLANLGAKPQRMVHTRVSEETLF